MKKEKKKKQFLWEGENQFSPLERQVQTGFTLLRVVRLYFMRQLNPQTLKLSTQLGSIFHPATKSRIPLS